MGKTLDNYKNSFIYHMTLELLIEHYKTERYLNP